MQDRPVSAWRRFALALAGILFGGFMPFHPANDAAGAIEPAWLPAHLAWLVAYVLILCGLPALRPGSMRGRWAGIGYGLAWLGTVLSLPIAAWDAFIVPYLAANAPGMIAEIEELSADAPVLAFRAVLVLAVAAWSLGYAMIGGALMRSVGMRAAAGLLLAVGAPLFWLGALAFSHGAAGNAVTTSGAIVFGLGLMLIGTRMQRRGQAAAQ